MKDAGARPGPAVSVCIPVYNGERFIAEAISSVLRQTFADFELIVSDNASTDRTLEIVAGFDDPRITCLRNETNLGPGRNYNRLMEAARGKYIKVLSADDYLFPDSLQRMVDVFEDEANVGVVLASAGREVVDDSGAHLLMRGRLRRDRRIAGLEAVRQMAASGTNIVGETSAALFRADAARKAGLFLDDAPYCVDMDYWFRLLEHGDLYVVSGVLSAYRVSSGSWSLDVLDRQAADVAELIDQAMVRGIAGITAADALRGARAAKRSARMRNVMYVIARIPASHREKLRFLVVGGWNTLFSIAALWLLDRFVPYDPDSLLHKQAVLVVHWVISVTQNFFTFKLLVFRSKGHWLHEYLRMYVTYAATFLIQSVLTLAVSQAFGLRLFWASLPSIAVIAVISYLGHRHFTFRRTHDGR